MAALFLSDEEVVALERYMLSGNDGRTEVDRAVFRSARAKLKTAAGLALVRIERGTRVNLREECARAKHRVAGPDGQCLCGVFPVGARA